MTYALALSEDERTRYRLMAEMARSDEGGYLIASGLRPGAAVADVGCGPGATLRLLAQEVGAGGRADGVDRDPAAVATAAEEVTGLPQAGVRIGEATDTGLPRRATTWPPAGTCWRTTAAGRPRSWPISPAWPAPGARCTWRTWTWPPRGSCRSTPDLADLDDRYREYHRALGNDLTVGRSLGTLLEGAGLEVRIFRNGGTVRRLPVGVRPPAWAAREALRAAGLADEDDVARWDAAFTRVDAEAVRPWGSMPICIAAGRLRGAR